MAHTLEIKDNHPTPFCATCGQRIPERELQELLYQRHATRRVRNYGSIDGPPTN